MPAPSATAPRFSRSSLASDEGLPRLERAPRLEACSKRDCSQILSLVARKYCGTPTPGARLVPGRPASCATAPRCSRSWLASVEGRRRLARGSRLHACSARRAPPGPGLEPGGPGVSSREHRRRGRGWLPPLTRGRSTCPPAPCTCHPCRCVPRSRGLLASLHRAVSVPLRLRGRARPKPCRGKTSSPPPGLGQPAGRAVLFAARGGSGSLPRCASPSGL